jgi:hypothetical protein
MPKHFHLVLRPRLDKDRGACIHWLLTMHDSPPLAGNGPDPPDETRCEVDTFFGRYR